MADSLLRVQEATKAAADRQGVRVDVVPVAVRAAIADVALDRCLVALVNNAISHAPENSRVEVVASSSGQRVQIRVTDRGAGIRGIDPQHVFDRFASGRGGRAVSHGIGLALVRETLARVGGTVSVESTGPEGTVFLLDLEGA